MTKFSRNFFFQRPRINKPGSCNGNEKRIEIRKKVKISILVNVVHGGSNAFGMPVNRVSTRVKRRVNTRVKHGPKVGLGRADITSDVTMMSALAGQARARHENWVRPQVGSPTKEHADPEDF